MKLRPIFGLALMALALAACTHLAPAPAFKDELNKQYQHLSTYENEPMYDWTDAQYFQSKGKLALKGRDVKPEDPATWDVPKEYLPELNNAADILMIALEADKKKITDPVNAAQAQAYFDCWVEQSQEKWLPKSSHTCRPAFYDAVCRMYKGKDCPVQRDMIYRVYFDTDSSGLDATAKRAIAQAAAAYKAGAARVVVAGHADRVGASDYNMALSKRRADAVEAELAKHGVSSHKVDEKYFGEEQPLVQTPDNVPNRNNRRVLIVVR